MIVTVIAFEPALAVLLEPLPYTANTTTNYTWLQSVRTSATTGAIDKSKLARDTVDGDDGAAADDVTP